MANFSKTSSFQSGVCSILANLMTKTEELRDLRHLFMQWDTSQDGLLSFDELRANMMEIMSVFHLDEPEVLKIMQRADVNGDGNVDYTEFLTAAFDKEKLLTEQNLENVFRLID